MQSMEWMHPGSRRPNRASSAGKVMASIFWDSQLPDLKSNLRGRNLGRNEGVTDAVDEYLGD